MAKVFLVVTASNVEEIKTDAAIHTAPKDAQKALWESANESVGAFIQALMERKEQFSADAIKTSFDSTGYELQAADGNAGIMFCKGSIEQKDLDMP
jgi:delta 1-pyrroline-5-carboxylate dehydrogenase